MATQASDSIKQRSRTTTADELTVVVQRAQAFTNASGAAIAIGNSEELVCRARSGSSAPDVGTAMRVEGSFTGLCIQTGKELRCDDAETDTRVDTAALRSLGIRSLVVTPIKDEGKVVGVLAVFAPTPHAFTITHVAVLKTMADQISTLLQKERRSPREDAHVEAPAPAPRPAPTPLPPVVIRSAVTSSSAGAAAAAPARTNGSSASVVEPVRPVAIAADITPVPFPKKEEKRESRRTEQKTEPASVPATRSSFAVLDAVAGEPQRSQSGKFVLIGGVIVVVAAAVVTWMFVGRHKADTSAATQPVQQPQATASAAQPTGAAVAPNSAATAPAPTTPVAASNTKNTPPEKPESKKPESQKKEKENKPSPATVEMASGGPSKISVKGQAEQPSDVAPSLSVGSSGSSSLNTLARPVGNSVPSILTQSELINAKAIRAIPAVYPEIAKARRISGTVVVRVTVGKDGKVSNPKFISGPMVFRDAAFDAVKQWLFKPATLNGVAIEQETEITVKFSSPS